ncbi:hypothetical protein B0H16DRAFT_1564373 [Mycena metata]|uniref:Uncharacterized protein n=1 Tax=Mycena metata TaxID=1033252 RepID=A0AAD7N1C3_9AGAR|nr:hypothetical protein B0H16DRAFT_1564373 [Mycena metata]
MFSATSTFTPYAEPERERERERAESERGRGRSIYSAGGGDADQVSVVCECRVRDDAVHCGRSRTSTCRRRQARWCSTRRGTLRRSPPHLLLQQFLFAASAAAADDTPPDASLLLLALRVPASSTHTRRRACTVTVRAPARAVFARGDAAAFVLCFVISLLFGDLFFGGYDYSRRCR